MSEKEIIENAKNFISIDILYGGRIVLLKSQLKFYQNTIQELLDLYNNLKEIEQSHKEENGKLRVEFEKVYEDNLTLAKELAQEKEKNKDLQKQLNGAFDRGFISKDKIRKFIEEELPEEEICNTCEIYDVNGISIKEKLEKILTES